MGFETPAEAARNHHDIGIVDRAKDPSDLIKEEHPQQRPESEQIKKRIDPNKQWPLVRFTSGQQLLVVPEQFEVVNAGGVLEARRMQVDCLLISMIEMPF